MSNNYGELWCLMNWAAPGCFGVACQRRAPGGAEEEDEDEEAEQEAKMGPKAYFEKFVAKPIKMGQQSNATMAELAEVGGWGRRRRTLCMQCACALCCLVAVSALCGARSDGPC